jgi:hypothetical protein
MGKKVKGTIVKKHYLETNERMYFATREEVINHVKNHPQLSFDDKTDLLDSEVLHKDFTEQSVKVNLSIGKED